MKAVESRGSTLEYLTLFPDDYEAGQPYPLIICLHGRGADMRDLAGLAPAIDQALTALDGLVREVFTAYQVAAGQALLLGFSQGGAMTYRYGMVRPEMFAGLVILSGALRNPEALLPRLPARHDQQIFIAHGTHDSVVPIDLSRDAVDFLAAQGYLPVYHEY